MRTLLLTTLLLCPAIANAQVTAGDEELAKTNETDLQAQKTVFTVNAAVAAAFHSHPALLAAEADVRQQDHLVYQVTRRPNPVVGYSASEVGNEGQAGQQGVFLNQNFVRGNKLSLNGQVQRHEVKAATEKLRLSRLQLEADVRLAYIEAAVAQEKSKLLRRLQRPLDRAATAARRLVDSGELSMSAALQSRLESERNRMQIRQADTQRNFASQNLATLLGWGELDSPLDENSLRPAGDRRSVEEIVPAILNASPELGVAGQTYARTQWKVRREEAEPIPDLQTQWSLQQDAATNYAVMGIQIGVELPIHDDNCGAINAARAEVWKRHHHIESIQRSLRQRAVQVISQRDQSQQQLTTIRDELEVLARENLDTTQRAFALGEATYLDLLNAQRAYIRLNLDTLSLYRQLAITHVHLSTMLVRADAN